MSQQRQEFEGKNKKKSNNKRNRAQKKDGKNRLNSEADEVVAHSPPECPYEQTDSGSIFPRLFRHP